MDVITMTDRKTGRSVSIRRPLPNQLTGAEVVSLEGIARTWCNPLREDQAEQDLDRLADGRPGRVLYGLLWLTGLWCSLCQARLGITLDEIVDGLDYQGPRRDLAGIDEETWEISNTVVRRGVRAVLDSDEDSLHYLDAANRLDPSLHRLCRHLLTIVDGLSQDMEQNDLAPWGAAARVVAGGGWE